MPDNVLYYGDNLDVLREHIKDDSVDLIYLDPPFNSKATYNVLFKEPNGSPSVAQNKAFVDTWHWDQKAAETYEETVERGGRVADVMVAFRTFLGENDMLAYLTMMAPRLIGLRRVLKPTGSIYLHCDPTASHYLKMLMDSAFGVRNYKNEIIWKRTTASSSKARAKRYGADHDTILFYVNSEKHVFNPTYTEYPEHEIARRFRRSDERGPYKDAELATYSEETLERLRRENRLIITPSGKYRYKIYLDEIKGVLADSVWTDIPPINSQAAERLGYQTQKPEKLLERIIETSSKKGDVVLDPFCGCGTAIVVAERLKRHWGGIDITFAATNLIKNRLKDAFGDAVRYRVIGEPVSVPDAAELAKSNPYQFQWWALGLVGARPTEEKKGADRGIDGRLYFHDDPQSKKSKQIIFSVKSGKTGVQHIRDLVGVIDREKAEMGVLITLQEPTQPMRTEAASAGFYTSSWGKHHRVQVLTIAELLEGKRVNYPPSRHVNVTFRKAPKANVSEEIEQTDFLVENNL